MKNSILVTTQGISGGKRKCSRHGCVNIETMDENVIIVDAYRGQGRDYKEREEEEITIIFSDKTQWTGTFRQLNEQLTK